MYKVMNNLVDNGSAPATLQPSNRTTGGQQPNLQVTYSRTNMHHNSFFPSVTLMWSSVPPEAQTAASLDAFKCKLGDQTTNRPQEDLLLFASFYSLINF